MSTKRLHCGRCGRVVARLEYDADRRVWVIPHATLKVTPTGPGPGLPASREPARIVGPGDRPLSEANYRLPCHRKCGTAGTVHTVSVIKLQAVIARTSTDDLIVGGGAYASGRSGPHL